MQIKKSLYICRSNSIKVKKLNQYQKHTSEININIQIHRKMNLIERQILQNQNKVQYIISSSRYNQRENYLILDKCSNIWIQIMKYQNWQELRSLSLVNCQIDDTDVEQLADLSWPNLEELYLYGNKIKTEGTILLMKNSWPKLRALHLSQNNIQDNGLSVIIQNLGLTLTTFVVKNCHLNMMIQTKNKIYLKKIVLSGNIRIGSLGIKNLIKASFPQLEVLLVDQCSIGNQGVKNLTKGNWPKLTHLNTGNNQINIDGHITHFEHNWKNLKCLTNNYLQPITYLHIIPLKTNENNIFSNISNQNIKKTIKQLKNNIFSSDKDIFL